MSTQRIPPELTVIPVSAAVIVPKMRSKIRVDEQLGKKLAESMATEGPFALAVSLKKKESDPPRVDNFYTIGSLVHLESIQQSNTGYVVTLKSTSRIKLEDMTIHGGLITARYSFMPLTEDLDESSRSPVMNFIHKTLTEISLYLNSGDAFLKQIEELKTIEEVVGFALPFMNLSVTEIQEILEIESEKELGVRFIDLLLGQKDSVEFQIEMTRDFHEKVNKSQREALLREQMKAIQQELGKGSDGKKGKKDYRELIEEAGMPQEIKEVALEQADKLESFGSENHEAGIVKNYLDLLVQLPWKQGEYKDLDIEEARRILNEDHYGIEKVKSRIIQHLAVMKLRKNKKGSILLFVGPPGTGKTSLAACRTWQ